VRLGVACGNGVGEKMIVWRQDGRFCRRGFTQSSRERGIDADFAAILPVKDSNGGLNGPRRRSSRGAKPKRTPTGVADPTALRRCESCLKCRSHPCGRGLTLTDNDKKAGQKWPAFCADSDVN
jgi:hypothetical protein